MNNDLEFQFTNKPFSIQIINLRMVENENLPLNLLLN